MEIQAGFVAERGSKVYQKAEQEEKAEEADAVEKQKRMNSQERSLRLSDFG